MKTFSIAGLQLHLSGQRSNLPYIKDRIDTMMYVFPWVQMVLLSELATYGPALHHAQPLSGPTEDAYCQIAKKHKLWLVNGSLFEKSEGKTFNTATVIAPDGEIVKRYRKMYPFRPYEMHVEGGDEFCLFEVPEVGLFGLSICYDMWFPETTRTLAARGAEVILHPSLTTTIDREVELSIVRASAAINQCFIFDINGLGAGGNGRSIICGPDGGILHQAGTSEEIIPMEIDLARVGRSRKSGMRGLGQTLKSFRDANIDYKVYKNDPQAQAYLNGLGILEKPTRKIYTPNRTGSHTDSERED